MKLRISSITGLCDAEITKDGDGWQVTAWVPACDGEIEEIWVPVDSFRNRCTLVWATLDERMQLVGLKYLDPPPDTLSLD
jgi:hypothetical protein